MGCEVELLWQFLSRTYDELDARDRHKRVQWRQPSPEGWCFFSHPTLSASGPGSSSTPVSTIAKLLEFTTLVVLAVGYQSTAEAVNKAL